MHLNKRTSILFSIYIFLLIFANVVYGQEIKQIMGEKIVNILWGSTDTDVGHDINTMECPASFFVDDTENIYLLDQINQRIKLFKKDSYINSIPLPSDYYFQDITLSKKGIIVLLDRLIKKEAVYIKENGKIIQKIPLKGTNIVNADYVTGIYSNNEGIWVKYAKNLIRISDESDKIDIKQQSLPGILSKLDTLILSVEKVSDLSVVLNIMQRNNTSSLIRKPLSFDTPVSGIEALDTDKEGNIYVFVHLFVEKMRDKYKDIFSQITLVVFDNQGEEKKRIAIRDHTLNGEIYKPIFVKSDGGIYQMIAEKDGLTIYRYNPLLYDLSMQLLESVKENDFQKTKNLINRDADVNIYEDFTGYTPLMIAIMNKNKEIAKYLIEKGAEINAINREGYSVFMYAAIYGQIDIMKVLLQKGVDINEPFVDIQQMVGYGEFTPLMLAIEYENIETVKFLIKMGADINVKTSYGLTPLSLAKRKSNEEIIRLIENE